MAHRVEVEVKERVRLDEGPLSADARREIRDAFKHRNPEYGKRLALGYSTWGIPQHEVTWQKDEADGRLSLPRGGMARVRQILRSYGHELSIVDARARGRPAKFKHLLRPRPYQVEAIEAGVGRENCILSAPTGCGKTCIAFALVARNGVWTMVVVPTGGLFDQWLKRAEEEMGLKPWEVGRVRGSDRSLRPLTVAMQKSLSIQGIDDEMKELFGQVIFDEVQTAAAPTVFSCVDPSPARFRIGISADYQRKDGKDYLIRDLFGAVAYQVTPQEVLDVGGIVEVETRVVATPFDAPWFAKAYDQNVAYNRLVDEIADSAERNALIVEHATREARSGNRVLLLARRREHCRELLRLLVEAGCVGGLMIGGDKDADRERERALRRLRAGEIRCAVGTYQSVGTGIDIPEITDVFACSPIATNKQLFGQVKGRASRPGNAQNGKRFYYFWDRKVFGAQHLENVVKWSTRCVVFDARTGSWIVGREFLSRAA